MKKATVIATCLVTSDIVRRIEDAEHLVRCQFEELRPKSDFAAWNVNVDDSVAKNIIETVGRASRINIERFIEDLN